MNSTLRGRLARTLGITAAVSVALTALISFGLVRRYAEQATIRELQDRASGIAREAEAIAPLEAAALKRLLLTSGDQIAFVTRRGVIQSQDAAAREVARAINLDAVRNGTPESGTIRTQAGTFAYAAEPVAGPRALTSAVVLSRPVALARGILGPIAIRVVIAGGLAVAVAIALGSVFARRLTKPLRSLSDATGRVAAGDLASRVPLEGDDEVVELAGRFNEMAGALSEARRREHEFLASVSHELRTPITAIRGYAEALKDGAVSQEQMPEAVEVIKSESERLERLVQDVMDLARLGAREFRLEIADVDLASTLHEAVRAHATAASSAGVRIVADADAPLHAKTDPARVRQIVSNLVENALRVTPASGQISVTGRATSGGLAVEVTDTGPGIAGSDLPHVFERSYLWTRSRGERDVGTGLGLAIVRELAHGLGGTLDVTSVLGRGTTFRLTLPAQ